MSLEGRQVAASYLSSRVTLVPIDSAIAIAAAEHRLAHYHRDRCPISYADSVAVIVAQQADAPLITVDTPLLSLGDTRILRPSQLPLNRS